MFDRVIYTRSRCKARALSVYLTHYVTPKSVVWYQKRIYAVSIYLYFMYIDWGGIEGVRIPSNRSNSVFHVCSLLQFSVITQDSALEFGHVYRSDSVIFFQSSWLASAAYRTQSECQIWQWHLLLWRIITILLYQIVFFATQIKILAPH